MRVIEKLNRYFEREKCERRAESLELIEKKKEIIRLKLENRKFKRLLVPDLEVGHMEELEWMMSENARVTEEVSYLRSKMIELFESPAHRAEVSQPKEQLHAEVVKHVEELSGRIKAFA